MNTNEMNRRLAVMAPATVSRVIDQLREGNGENTIVCSGHVTRAQVHAVSELLWPTRPAITIKEAKAAVRAYGLRLTVKDGEYRVFFPWASAGGEGYFTNDRHDAVVTAERMRDEALKSFVTSL